MTFKDFKRIMLKVHNYLFFFTGFFFFFFFLSFCFVFNIVNMKIKYWSTKYNCAVSSAFVQKEKKTILLLKYSF